MVTDNGYYSQSNMAEFAHNNMKFLTPVRSNVSWVREEIDQAREDLGKLKAVCSFDRTVSCVTRRRMHKLSIVRQRTRGDIVAGQKEAFERRLYVHVIYSRDNIVKDEQNLIEDLFELKQLIEKGETLSEAGQNKADKYLVLSRVGRGGRLKVEFNEQAFEKAKTDFGYFVLVSNEAMEAEEALRLYREREKFEEMFNVQKNSLDGKRPRVWFPDNLKGRLFCQFVALGYHSFLTRALNKVKDKLGQDATNKTAQEIAWGRSVKRWLDGN